MRHWSVDLVVIAEAPPRREGGRTTHPKVSPRRRLDADGCRLVRHLREQGRTLREIAEVVRVSHETVRSVLRDLESSEPVPTPGRPSSD